MSDELTDCDCEPGIALLGGASMGFCGCILGLAAWGYRKKQPSIVEDQVAFVPIPRTSPVVSHFDPRHEDQDDASGVESREKQ